ncbi:gem-associated protein 5-like [Leguminivora glycinivorella]|uniref:gem-associated protein 5-like n=1 Tax=Leguminivora glycinivorella TaxID=1035111 RepID=UPI00200F6587|nr:gem-associated protein 5-like [Leguminivora glycinivorella]
MDETVLFPSPNWFQVSGLVVSNDGWLAYGGPSKSLCVLKPVPADGNGVVEGAEQYTAHVLNRAHPDKIVSLDISPEWPEKKLLLTGSASGSVKQWSLEDANVGIKFKSNLSHDIHTHEKEEIIGVAYSNEVYAVTVGSFGNIVKWDLNANVVKTFNNMLKTSKPTCMACSHHITLNVAIGTKQGVLFVVDLTGAGSLIYKVRSQDDEIMNVSWCPQYEVQVGKSVDESQRTGIVTEKPSKLKLKKGATQKEPQKYSASERMERIRQQEDLEEKNTSGIKKDLPQDSFEDFVVVPEDDMFDIYKDHEADEFGHKKYQPEDILVKIKEPEEQNDYLAECLKLKDAILKKKNEPEPSIESLVEALEKSDLNSESGPKEEVPSGSKVISDSSHEEINSKEEQEESSSVSSVHMHKHLLATIGKHGGVRIWSKTGKLVASCALSAGKQQGRFRNSWATLVWCQPELLLIADGKNQLLECNPLKPDCKNKLVTKLIHNLHKRGLHCVATNACRANTASPVAWSASQDRSLVRYSLRDRSTAVYNTCGGFVYNVQYCPYDVNKVAVSVGDGAVRVWTAEESEEAEGKLSAGRVVTYWQHVQGKVLTVAWHPTKENLLAFGTAESRVGLIEAGFGERPARTLGSGLSGGVYALGWGAERLYAAARQELRAYCTDRPDESGTPVPVSVEGASWGVTAVRVRDGLMCVGSDAGGVAVLRELESTLLAATFVGSKMIHTIEWHPQQTSFANEESPHKNLIAVCSQDKANAVVILEYIDKEENQPKLIEFKRLIGHTNTVLQVAWSPHYDMRLLSTSHDGTVRVWDVTSGTCVSIFGGHGGTALGAAWAAPAALSHHVLSGGADCCLRLWDARRHTAEAYVETKEEAPKKDKKKKKDKKEIKPEAAAEDSETADTESNGVAATLESKVKISKKFLLPTITKQMQKPKTKGAKRLLHNFMVKKNLETAVENTEEYDLDYIKMFGNSKEVNEIFDMEMEHHLRVGNTESWLVLCVLRGHIDAALRLAAERDLLCPYLLSLAPGVSSKYWKDACKLYLAQIDRLVANGEEEKLVVNKNYGGPVYRKVLTMLSLQDVIGAVKTLVENKLYKEAYLLCRIRYMDTIGEEVLQSWAKNCLHSGMFDMAAVCHLALGNLLEAATCLSKCPHTDNLSLAAELARAAGQTILADNLIGRTLNTPGCPDVATELDKMLPSRAELFLREVQSIGGADGDNGKDDNE